MTCKVSGFIIVIQFWMKLIGQNVNHNMSMVWLLHWRMTVKILAVFSFLKYLAKASGIRYVSISKEGIYSTKQIKRKTRNSIFLKTSLMPWPSIKWTIWIRFWIRVCHQLILSKTNNILRPTSISNSQMSSQLTTRKIWTTRRNSEISKACISTQNQIICIKALSIACCNRCCKWHWNLILSGRIFSKSTLRDPWRATTTWRRRRFRQRIARALTNFRIGTRDAFRMSR